VTSHVLRPYQIDAVDQIRKLFQEGTRNVLLHMATGSGKTVIFSTIMKGVHAKGRRCVLAVRGRELVDNASQRLHREGVPHGVMMAGHWNYRPTLPIQVCSIDTLSARRLKQKLPDADLVVIDEAHMACSPSFRWFIEEYRKKDSFFLSVSATPHNKAGLAHLADAVVYPISIGELIEQNYLVAPKYYAPPSSLDLKKIKVDSRTGDYNISQLCEEAEKANLVGDIIPHYRRLAYGRPAILFSASIKHSLGMVSALNDAGISALHVDAESSDEERRHAISCLEKGTVKILSNVGIFCTGVDVPCVSCIIMARPTKSYNLYIQQAGRGTRPHQGKEDFIILDHAGNVIEHGLIESEMKCVLKGFKKNPVRQITTCKACFHAWDAVEQARQTGKGMRDYTCLGILPDGSICMEDNSPVQNNGDREAKEITSDKFSQLMEIKGEEHLKEIRFHKKAKRLYDFALMKGYKSRWIFYKLKEEYGTKAAESMYQKLTKGLP
jgi:superfamily II DNA or RNA helicase